MKKEKDFMFIFSSFALKAIIFLGLLIMLLYSCTKEEKQIKKERDEVSYNQKLVFKNYYGRDIYTNDTIISGMKYIIFTQYNGGMIVLNTTKDSLECALLKKNLK